MIISIYLDIEEGKTTKHKRRIKYNIILNTSYLNTIYDLQRNQLL